ncbi:MAG: hypothetical protein ACK4R6_14060 [Spirosomataceae bacterium]
MKNNVLFILISLVSLLSCENIYDVSLDKPVLEPIIGKAQYSLFSERNGSKIVEEKMGDEANFLLELNAKRHFMFSYYPVYYGENLKNIEWSDSGNYIFVYLNKSTRYKGGNRLALFSLEMGKPELVFDERTLGISEARFEGKKFIYTLQDGTERSIELK